MKHALIAERRANEAHCVHQDPRQLLLLVSLHKVLPIDNRIDGQEVEQKRLDQGQQKIRTRKNERAVIIEVRVGSGCEMRWVYTGIWSSVSRMVLSMLRES